MSTALLMAAYTADTLRRLRESLAAAESRAQAAEARAAMLERTMDEIAKTTRLTHPLGGVADNHPAIRELARRALTASPSPLAQAIEGVLAARSLVLLIEARTALRTAWRGAEPGETT